ncbi:C4-dicarboxylate transporter [Paramagnetospirillum marisnigri]|uniref:C4-dicarboxylate transporter n=1 Tax=Paramagnetospirillum marisnigri TaxID=1285242 RepID=A0A178MW59_9PROT|nr:C4-dicarboxylate transporter [Paramagnetospirillum marisnigri]
MPKWIIRAAAACLLAAGLVGTAMAEGRQTWTASYQFSPGDPRDEAMRAIAHQVARVGLDIRLFPSASLLRPTDQWNALTKGNIDMVFIPADYLLDRFPQLAALSLPGVVRGPAHAERIAASAVMRDLRQQIEAAGVMVIAESWMPGAYATRGRCVTTPADAKGLKARTIGPFMSEFWAAAGATPVAATTSDTLPILVNSGLIDVANTSVMTLLSLRMEKSFACLTVPGESGALWYLYEPILVSKRRFEALDERGRRELLAAAARAHETLAASVSLSTRRLAGNFLAAGIEVVDLDANSLTAWHKLARKTAWKQFRDQVPGGAELLDRLQAVE